MSSRVCCLYKTISLMERLDIVKLMRKDSSSLGLFNIVERSELKIVLLRPSVTEKCQSVFHLEEKEN